MLYRLYRPDDFPQLYAIEETCFKPPLRFSRRYMQQIINCKDSAAWIAEENDRLTGFAVSDWANESEGTIAYVQTIEVAPEYRRQGIGSQLLQRCEDSAQSAGAILIWLHVDAQNGSALRLYRAHGYQQGGRREHYYARGRAAEIYVKPLQSPAGRLP